MKKLILIMMTIVGSMTLNAQISRSTTDSKVAEFTKMVETCVGGGRVNMEKLDGLYVGLNCMLIESQSEALGLDLATTREDVCGSAEFPRTQSLSDATFKRYAESVQKYLDYKTKNGLK